MLRRGLLLAGLLLLAACSRTPSSPAETTNLAAQQLGTDLNDAVADIAADTRRGAVYAIGTTDGSLDGPNKGGTDVFLRRYSRSGAVVWRRQFGGGGDDGAGAVAVNRNGDLYLRYSLDTYNFDGTDSSGVSTVSRLEKRRGDGTLVWTRTRTGSAPEQLASEVATDASGNVYVLDTIYNGSFGEVVLSKYTGAGSLLWTKTVDPTDESFAASGLGTDASGNVYVGVIGWDDEDRAESLVYKYSPAGTELSRIDIPDGEKNFRLRGLTVRGDGLYIVGTSSVRWFSEDPPNDDAFVVKLSLGGAERWRRIFNASARDGGNDVSADADGGVYVTGYTEGNLGGVYNGGSDIFLRKLDARGNPVWTKQIGSRRYDYGNAVVAYGSNEVYLAGEAGGALQGGTYRGEQDGFLRRTDGQGNRVWTDQ